MSKALTLLNFRDYISQICTASTSSDSAKWTPENPLYAHCAAVSLLAQDIFGGDLLRASLLPYPEFAHMRSHYWNRLPDGNEEDFTAPQFCGRRPNLSGEVKTRDYVLYDPATGKPREIVPRYELLAQRFADINQ